VIGIGNKLAVMNGEDLKHFKTETVGHWIIMGRKTVESLPKKLPNRTVICISSDPDYANEKCDHVCTSIVDVFMFLESKLVAEAFVCGGETIYEMFAPYVTEVILTSFDTSVYDVDMKKQSQFKFVPYALMDAMSSMRVVNTKEIVHGQVIYYKQWQKHPE
jgi:dihydrofolate reductase